jgi:hypothetical protein
MTGKIKLPMQSTDGYEFTDTTKTKLKDAWLKG